MYERMYNKKKDLHKAIVSKKNSCSEYNKYCKKPLSATITTEIIHFTSTKCKIKKKHLSFPNPYKKATISHKLGLSVS